MILAAMSLLAATPRDPGNAPAVPPQAQALYDAYLQCLLEPLEPAFSGNLPRRPAAREAVLRRALAGCASLRASTVSGMERVIPRIAAWSRPDCRRREIDWILTAAEQRLALLVVDREQFLRIAEEVRRCESAGKADCAPQH